MGILGQNGIGKSTMMKVLSGTMIPNLECGNEESAEVLKKYRGTGLFRYLTALYNGELVVKVKPQNVYGVAERYGEIMVRDWLGELEVDGLDHLLDQSMNSLSGGELQRLICYRIMAQEADVYIFDEPSNFLDIKQRMDLAQRIRGLVDVGKYVLVVEHDLTILDYISDRVCIMYGQAGAYGQVSQSHGTDSGINMYLDGYLRGDNVRIRAEPLVTSSGGDLGYELEDVNAHQYEGFEVRYDNFLLTASAGEILQQGIVVVLGENGSGKSSFLKHLAGSIGLSVSFKRQEANLERVRRMKTVPTVREMYQKTFPIVVDRIIE